MERLQKIIANSGYCSRRKAEELILAGKVIVNGNVITEIVNDPEIKDKVIYFGPMGCRTGFYFILAGDYTSSDIVDIMIRTFNFISDFEGDVPGATPRDCGNYLDMNLPLAKYIAKRYLEETLLKLTPANLNYPS